MFGIRYKVLCPKCKKMFEANHGITTYYKLPRQSHRFDYCVENCPHCKHSFFRIRLDEDIHSARIRGLTIDECVEEKLNMIHSYRTTTLDENKVIRALIEKQYNIPSEELSIPVTSVPKDMLVWSTTICW